MAASERDRPDIANHRVQRRKHQLSIIKTASSPVFIGDLTVIMDNPGKLQSHMRVHSRRWRQALLAAQMRAGSQSDRADLRRDSNTRLKHLLCKAPRASSKRSAPQAFKSSLYLLSTNAQTISRFFRLCANLTAVMHSNVARARSTLKRCVRATRSGKTKRIQCCERSSNCALRSAR
jgi:hypothetical protein